MMFQQYHLLLNNGLLSIGYKINPIYVECEMKEFWKRNVERSNDNISAYHTEPYHRRWILEAVQQEGI